MTSPERIGVIILAGGDGRRIGGNKPLKRLAGTTLIERALTSARRWSDTVAIAVRSADQLEYSAGWPLLCDQAGEGPLAGLASARPFAEAHGLEGVLMIPCDAPLLPADLLPRLAAALTPPARVAVASSGGRLHPTISLWRLAGLNAVPGYMALGQSSLMGLLEQVGFAEVAWSTDPFDPFLNINTEQDLQAAAAIVAGIEAAG